VQIGVASWSLRGLIDSGELPLTEFPRYVKQNYGVDYVELSQLHFRAYDARYLDQIRDTCQASGVKVINIPVDIGDVSQPNDRARKHDLRALALWIDIAEYLDSPGVRFNTGRYGQDQAGFQRIVESFRELAEYARPKGISVVLENHGGISSEPNDIKRLFEEVNHPNFRSCPDFGNFSEENRLVGIRVMAEYALLAHCKTYDFLPNGEFDAYDFEACLQTLKENGFDGVLSIEFEGRGDQVKGVEQSINLVRKTLRAIDAT
jgi:sugar phosphate isomerase/epimerase